MTHKGIFEDAILMERQKKKIKQLNARIKDLMTINEEHQTINGKLRSELEIEKKNHTITREDNDRLNIEIGRLMKKLQDKHA